MTKTVKKGTKATEFAVVRLTPEEKKTLDTRVNEKGMTIAGAIKHGLRSIGLLDKDEEKS